MTTIEEHLKAIAGFENDIKEKIQMNLLVERQKIIGFACSEGAVNYFAVLLHSKKLVTEGFNVNHTFFASREIAESRFYFKFPKKDELLTNLVEMEMLREKLCYGRTKSISEIEKAVKLFYEIKRMIEEELGEKI
jgi:hypothetical protein